MTGLEVLYANSPEFREAALEHARAFTGSESDEFAQEWLERDWTPEWQKREQEWINERGLCE